jgi:hypothetical protein
MPSLYANEAANDLALLGLGGKGCRAHKGIVDGVDMASHLTTIISDQTVRNSSAPAYSVVKHP